MQTLHSRMCWWSDIPLNPPTAVQASGRAASVPLAATSQAAECRTHFPCTAPSMCWLSAGSSLEEGPLCWLPDALILPSSLRQQPKQASCNQNCLRERPGQCLQGQETTNIYQHPPWSDSFVLQILPLEVTALRGQSFCAVRMSIRERLTSFGLERALKTRRNGLTKGFTTGGFQHSPGAGPDFTALL